MEVGVPRIEVRATGVLELELARCVELPPFRRAEDGGVPSWGTRVALAWDEAALQVRFTCRDDHAWSTFTRRDEPLWREEAVEVFLAAGSETPRSYFELELSPRGVLFDARIDNPHGDRNDFRADPSWDCAGIGFRVGRLERADDWWVALAIPFEALGLAEAPPTLRANFFRIERPRDREPEFSCWRPTWITPADFHRPRHFGLLRLIR